LFQLASEREETEQDKWEIIKQARDAQERAVILRTQLESKEQHIKKLEMELNEVMWNYYLPFEYEKKMPKIAYGFPISNFRILLKLKEEFMTSQIIISINLFLSDVNKLS